MKMKFKFQIIISAILLIIGFVLSLYSENDIFYNLVWTLVGLTFILNPVYPSNIFRLKPEDAKKGVRIAGAILIFIGLTNGFAV